MPKPDGGRAFPSEKIEVNDTVVENRGMTLRDYFAAKALAGMMLRTMVIFKSPDNDWTPVAFEAYKIADAMILERSKE